MCVYLHRARSQHSPWPAAQTGQQLLTAAYGAYGAYDAYDGRKQRGENGLGWRLVHVFK